jgi:hypothetical protein
MVIATRDDGARLIYDGMRDMAGIKEIPVANIEIDGRKGPSQSALSGLVHGGQFLGWTIQISQSSWDTLMGLMSWDD